MGVRIGKSRIKAGGFLKLRNRLAQVSRFPKNHADVVVDRSVGRISFDRSAKFFKRTLKISLLETGDPLVGSIIYRHGWLHVAQLRIFRK
jgi:hypothetical protein